MDNMSRVEMAAWVCLGIFIGIAYQFWIGPIHEKAAVNRCKQVITEMERPKYVELRKSIYNVSERFRHLGKNLEDIGSPVWKRKKSEIMEEVDSLLKQGHEVNNEIDRTSSEQKKEVQKLSKKLIDIKRLANKNNKIKVQIRNGTFAFNKTEL